MSLTSSFDRIRFVEQARDAIRDHVDLPVWVAMVGLPGEGEVHAGVKERRSARLYIGPRYLVISIAPFFERLDPAAELLCLANVARHLGFQCGMTGRKHAHAGKKPTLGVLKLLVFSF
jgi:hypothetical protein